MKRTTFAGALVVVAIFTMFGSASVVRATDQHEHASEAKGDQSSGTKMGEMKQAMGDKMAQGKANTQRLDALMAQVRNASGDAKVAAMADVIAVLLEERAAMQEHHATACPMMKK